jgi:hypothetical protein
MTVFSTTRRTLLTLIGGLSVFRAAQSGEKDTFTLVPELTEGQIQRYRLDQQSVRNGTIAHRARSTVALEIRERVAGGWLARWTSSDGELLEVDPRVRPMLEALHALWEGVAIDLLLDEGGRVAGLADPAAVRALGEMSLDRIVELLSSDPAHAPVVDSLRAIMQPMMTDEGMLAQSLLKEPAILLGAMGHAYRVGTPLEVRTRIPSPIGSGTIPILGRYQVRGIASRGSRADIGWLMVIDRERRSHTRHRDAGRRASRRSGHACACRRTTGSRCRLGHRRQHGNSGLRRPWRLHRRHRDRVAGERAPSEAHFGGRELAGRYGRADAPFGLRGDTLRAAIAHGPRG